MRVLALSLISLLTACGQQAVPVAHPIDPEYEWVRPDPMTDPVAPAERAIAVAECPVGKYPVSGGFVQSRNAGTFRLVSSYPLVRQWRVEMVNTAATEAASELYVWVLCAKGVPEAPT